MFGKTISLFKLFGFEVKIDLSWIIIALLITWSLAKGVFPSYYKGLSTTTYWWMGIFGALGLFFSIVFHELCHSLVARKFNLPMKGITLFICLFNKIYGLIPALVIFQAHDIKQFLYI